MGIGIIILLYWAFNMKNVDTGAERNTSWYLPIVFKMSSEV